jgi:hypothetical protein
MVRKLIPALKRLRQEDHEFGATLGCIESSCFKIIIIMIKIIVRVRK